MLQRTDGCIGELLKFIILSSIYDITELSTVMYSSGLPPICWEELVALSKEPFLQKCIMTMISYHTSRGSDYQGRLPARITFLIRKTVTDRIAVTMKSSIQTS